MKKSKNEATRITIPTPTISRLKSQHGSDKGPTQRWVRVVVARETGVTPTPHSQPVATVAARFSLLFLPRRRISPIAAAGAAHGRLSLISSVLTVVQSRSRPTWDPEPARRFPGRLELATKNRSSLHCAALFCRL